MNLRRILNIVLMLLMLTPSMVCVMVVYPEKAQAAVESTPPCHGTQDQQNNSASSPMLMGDCTLNDLGQALSVDIPTPEVAYTVIVFLIPILAFSFPAFAGMRSSGADPPIKGRTSFHRILITQRILQ